MIKSASNVWQKAILVLTLIAMASCAPTYDEQTDKQITAVQLQSDAGLVRLISLGRRIEALEALRDPASQKTLSEARSKASYDSNIDFYDKLDTDLTNLEMRMTATPDLSAANLTDSFRNIRENIDDLRKFHAQRGTVSPDAISLIRTPINQQFKTLMQYELNLKGGKRAAT